MTDNDRALTTVLETGDPAMLAVVKSVLDGAGIAYVTSGEALHELFGSRALVVRVQVEPERADEARALLAADAPAAPRAEE